MVRSMPNKNKKPLLFMTANRPGYLPFAVPIWIDRPASTKKLPPTRIGTARQKNGFSDTMMPKKNWAIKTAWKPTMPKTAKPRTKSTSV